MSKEELERIYTDLEYAAEQLEKLARLLLDIKARLASGGGPGPKP